MPVEESQVRQFFPLIVLAAVMVLSLLPPTIIPPIYKIIIAAMSVVIIFVGVFVSKYYLQAEASGFEVLDGTVRPFEIPVTIFLENYDSADQDQTQLIDPQKLIYVSRRKVNRFEGMEIYKDVKEIDLEHQLEYGKRLHGTKSTIIYKGTAIVHNHVSRVDLLVPMENQETIDKLQKIPYFIISSAPRDWKLRGGQASNDLKQRYDDLTKNGKEQTPK